MTNETPNTKPVKTTKPRRWFRFRLRTLLILVTVLSVPIGWIGWELDQRRRERKVTAWVEEMGGFVQIHAGPYVKQSWWEETKDSWWKQTKDIWFAGRVCRVYLEETQVSDLTPLAELKNLEVLDLRNTQLSELQQGIRGIKSAEKAKSRLKALVEFGYGTWSQSKSPSGGPSKRIFQLTNCLRLHNHAKPKEKIVP